MSSDPAEGCWFRARSLGRPTAPPRGSKAVQVIVRRALVQLLLVCALWVALVCPSAHGATPPEPSASEKDTARQLMDVGDAKFAEGDYQAALEAYQGADEIMGVPSTGVAVGRTQAKLGLLVEARDSLLRVTRFPQKPGESSVYVDARREAAQLAAALVERIPTVKIEVTGAADGTELDVRVDDKPVAKGTLRFPRRMSPGKHAVVVRAQGYFDGSATVDLAEGDREVVTIALKRDPNAPVEAATEPDGPEPSPANGSDDEGGLSPLVWVGFGVGAAGLLVGTITGAVALSRTSSLRDTCGGDVCGPQHEDDVKKAEAIAHGSTASFAIGGVGVALGVVALLWLSGGDEATPDAAAMEGASVSPWIGVGSAGLTGRF